ncbi:MAG: PrsW family glutamic-type intramembrane protease [Thermoplasmata archaeon]
MTLSADVLSFALAFALTAPFIAWLRPRPLTFAIGATLLAVVALVVELEVEGGLPTLFSDVLLLVLFGPIIEELLKFAASGFTGANYSTAAGAGIGFAAAENGVYFLAAWGIDTTTQLALLVIVRAATDPILHSTACTLSTISWRGRLWGLPAAVVLHSTWNLSTLIYAEIDPTAGLVLFLSFGAALFGLMLLLRRSPVLREELNDDYRLRPVSGSEVYVGAGG